MSEFDFGFIGLGALGSALLENALERDARVAIWNRSKDKILPFQDKGCASFHSPAELVKAVPVLVTCLSDDKALMDVLEKPGVQETLKGKTHISMSTLSLELTERLSDFHEEADCAFVAAPVLGRADVVRKGAFKVLLAGRQDARKSADAALSFIAKDNVVTIGDTPRMAMLYKLGMNFLVAAAIGSMAEAFAFIESNGGDAEKLHAMATGGPFNCPLYTMYGGQMLSGAYKNANFSLTNGLKDLKLVHDIAGKEPLLTDALIKRMQEACENGQGNYDWTGVIEAYRAAQK